MTTEIHAFEAIRISQESANINIAMGEIFSAIKASAKIGKYHTKIVGSTFNCLSETEQQICITRLISLSYKIVKTPVSLTIIWREELKWLPNYRTVGINN